MHTGSIMDLLGKFSLRYTRGEIRKHVNFFVIDEDVRPL